MSRGDYALSYEVSPIILTSGIARNVPGGAIPIVNLTNPGLYEQSLLSTGAQLQLNNFFAHYAPLPGATLIDNDIGMYPFANQATAANAIITKPLRISLLMMVPVNNNTSYQIKTQKMAALQKTLSDHNNAAGTYTIATPSRTYTNCIMTSFSDASGGESKQAQNVWRIDFVQPLLTLEAAQAAQNSQMEKISSGLPIPGDPPKVQGVGVINPNIGTSTVKSSRPLVGANL